MDRELWTLVTGSVDRALLKFPGFGRAQIFNDRLIVLLLLWAVWHDRCLSLGLRPQPLWRSIQTAQGAKHQLVRPPGQDRPGAGRAAVR
jgi:hypothetical protein